MNKIDPLAIIALLVFVLLLVLYKESDLDSSLHSLNSEISQFEAESAEISRRNNIWKDEKKDRQTIDSLLSSSEIGSAKVNKNISKNLYKFEVESLNQRGADFVTNKLLNSSLKLKSIELSRSEENNTSTLTVKAEVEL